MQLEVMSLFLDNGAVVLEIDKVICVLSFVVAYGSVTSMWLLRDFSLNDSELNSLCAINGEGGAEQ